ncbi:hypothetical protein [Thalassobacillus hwangdonensis]|uniref:Transposase n=1 Tax=Thalassobacillus hwangdonensis TaxID=546108 RepID=A0ABW3KZN0_9BACI
MGDLIPFPKRPDPPKPKIPLTYEESLELSKLEELVKDVDSLRKLIIAKIKVNRFIKKVHKRHRNEENGKLY